MDDTFDNAGELLSLARTRRSDGINSFSFAMFSSFREVLFRRALIVFQVFAPIMESDELSENLCTGQTLTTVRIFLVSYVSRAFSPNLKQNLMIA